MFDAPTRQIGEQTYRLQFWSTTKALDWMEELRLIVRQQGRGTFVATPSSEELNARFERLRTSRGESVQLEMHVLDAGLRGKPAAHLIHVDAARGGVHRRAETVPRPCRPHGCRGHRYRPARRHRWPPAPRSCAARCCRWPVPSSKSSANPHRSNIAPMKVKKGIASNRSFDMMPNSRSGRFSMKTGAK